MCESDQPGLLCDAAGHRFVQGEEVRLWVEIDGESSYFESTVVKVGAAVPGRGPDGLVLAFMLEIAVPEGESDDGSIVEILLPGGAAISLLEAPARLVDIAISRLSFELPRGYGVIFPEGGPLRLRMASFSDPPCESRGRINRVAVGERYVNYTVHIQDVERADLHQRLIAGLTEIV